MKKLISILFTTAIVITITLGTKTEYSKISDTVKNALEYSNEDKLVVYVYFEDKGPNAEQLLNDPLLLVSEKSLERRKKVLPPNKLVDITDVPVYSLYVNQVAAKTIKVRHQLKWFNCVSVEASKSQVLDIAALEFVEKIELVERYRKVQENDEMT